MLCRYGVLWGSVFDTCSSLHLSGISLTAAKLTVHCTEQNNIVADDFEITGNIELSCKVFSGGFCLQMVGCGCKNLNDLLWSWVYQEYIIHICCNVVILIADKTNNWSATVLWLMLMSESLCLLDFALYKLFVSSQVCKFLDKVGLCVGKC